MTRKVVNNQVNILAASGQCSLKSGLITYTMTCKNSRQTLLAPGQFSGLPGQISGGAVVGLRLLKHTAGPLAQIFQAHGLSPRAVLIMFHLDKLISEL